MDILTFLNNNSGAFSILFAAIVAISTAVYAVLTWKLVSETRKLREFQTEPNMSITLQPKEAYISFIDMVIENIGLGAAYDIYLKVDPDFVYEQGRSLSDKSYFKNGIKYLKPGQKIQFFLTSMLEDHENKIKTSLEIISTYKDRVGKEYESVFIIDFSELRGLTTLGTPPLHKIAEEISKIRQTLGHVSTGFRKLGVELWTQKDLDRKRKERMVELGQVQEAKREEEEEP